MNVIVREFSPPLSLGADAALVKPILILGQLTQERGAHLKVGSARVQEFKCL
jgi:hypothetical protein